jgi:aspartate carbamoyltransferase catalytic subunit
MFGCENGRTLQRRVCCNERPQNLSASAKAAHNKGSVKHEKPQTRGPVRSESSMLPRHLLNVRPMTRQNIQELFRLTDDMKSLVVSNGGCKVCQHKVVGVYFCEPSTRTSISFQVAMQRLGGTVVTLHNSDSSVKKGETYDDTIHTLASYCDVLIIRHPVEGSVHRAAQLCQKPIVNAGNIISQCSFSAAC